MTAEKQEPVRILFTPEAAKRLRVNPGWLEKARVAGADAPPFIRIGAQRVAYRADDLDKWLRERPRQQNSIKRKVKPPVKIKSAGR